MEKPREDATRPGESSESTSFSLHSVVMVYGITITLYGILLALCVDRPDDQFLAALVGICIWILTTAQAAFGTDLFAQSYRPQRVFRRLGLGILAWALPMLLLVIGIYVALGAIAVWLVLGVVGLLLVPGSWLVNKSKESRRTLAIAILAVGASMIAVNCVLYQILQLDIAQHFATYLISNSVLVVIQTLVFVLWSVKTTALKTIRNLSELAEQASRRTSGVGAEQGHRDVLGDKQPTVIHLDREMIQDTVDTVFGQSRLRAQVYLAVDGEKTVSDIARTLERSAAAVANEIRILRENFLIQVKSNQKGRTIYEQTHVGQIMGIHDLLRSRFPPHSSV